MFCTKCGKEIEAEWVKCPYCGMALKEEEVPDRNETNWGKSTNPNAEVQRKLNMDSAGGMEDIPQEQPMDSMPPVKRERKIKQRSLLKMILLSFITFGIYGIYFMYEWTEDVNAICEGDGKKSPNYIIVLLLSIVTVGIYYLYWWYRQGCRIQESAPRYGVQVRESGAIVLIWQILGASVMMGIGSLVSTYIMLDNVNRIALGYNGEVSVEELRNMGKPHPKVVRNALIVYGIFLVVAIITIVMVVRAAISLDATEETETKQPSVKMERQEPKDYSGMDLEQYLGKSENALAEEGFTPGDDDSEYELLSGDVVVKCDGGKVLAVKITDGGKEMPSFHGVRVGMKSERVTALLVPPYDVLDDKSGDGMVYVDMDSNVVVLLQISNGIVTDIGAAISPADKLREYMSNEYIFPDSDKKYLSEDEVRSVEVDKLLIGRNEIFARHGYIFKDEDLKKYFENTSWYKGTVPAEQFDADKVFNDFEKKNVEMIKKVEDEVNGVKGNAPAQKSFIQAGTYENDQLITGCQALVMVDFTSVDWFQVKIHTMPETNSLTLQGGKIDENTVELTDEYSRIKVTLHWDSAREVTLSSSGELTGMDSAIFNKLINAHYTLASGF